MGIVVSTLAPVAIRFAWVCQILLDPEYSSIQSKQISSGPVKTTSQMVAHTSRAHMTSASRETTVAAKSNLRPRLTNKSTEDDSLEQENDHVVSSTPSSQRSQNTRLWYVTSSSGCSSDSESSSESDSETELRVSGYTSNNEEAGTSTTTATNQEKAMSAAEEKAIRLTVGRGHFTRTKTDLFLNHLRLEKRLNELNGDHLTAATAARKQMQRHTLPRCNPTGNYQRLI